MRPGPITFMLMVSFTLSKDTLCEVKRLPPLGAEETQDLEILPAKDYLKLTLLETIPSDILRFDKGSGQFMYLGQKEAPYLFLYGSLKEGYSLKILNTPVPSNRGRFQFKYKIPNGSLRVLIQITDPQGKEIDYPVMNHWERIPPSFRFRIQEGEKIFEKTYGYPSEIRPSAFVQLYSGAKPATVVDLDSQKYAKLTFRIQHPKDTSYDAWALVIRNSENRVVTTIKRVGSPPHFLDWREVASTIFEDDSYTYRVNLFQAQMVHEGVVNRFETVEGLSVLHHDYLPNIVVEPKGELGYFSFRNKEGVNYTNLLLAADLPLIFWDRFLLRGTALTTIHSIDPQAIFTFTRVGAGFRLFGNSSNNILGNPFIFRLDLLVNHTGFTTYPAAPIKRHSHISFLAEPHFVFWAYHYVVPWIEYGMRVQADQIRLSYGIHYHFFIRPWQVKFGLGIAWDRLLKLAMNRKLEFTVFRAMTGFTFFL